jgi:excisionase family DNA binding protein
MVSAGPHMATTNSLASADNRCALDPLATDEEAAAYLRVKKQTLRKWRVAGDGPLFVRIGGAVRYRLSDLIAFVEARVRSSTSEA